MAKIMYKDQHVSSYRLSNKDVQTLAKDLTQEGAEPPKVEFPTKGLDFPAGEAVEVSHEAAELIATLPGFEVVEEAEAAREPADSEGQGKTEDQVETENSTSTDKTTDTEASPGAGDAGASASGSTGSTAGSGRAGRGSSSTR